MPNVEQEYHIVNIKVKIQQLSLSVKFPCSVFFQLKNVSQALINDPTKKYNLINDKCQPNEELTYDMEVPIDINGNYHQKKIYIVVIIASANGQIPTGQATIKISKDKQLFGKQQQQMVQALVQKCPDKSATLSLILKTQIIQTLKKTVRQQSVRKSRLLSSNMSQIEQHRNQFKNQGHIVIPHHNNSEVDLTITHRSNPKIQIDHTHKYKLPIQKNIHYGSEEHSQRNLSETSEKSSSHIRRSEGVHNQVSDSSRLLVIKLKRLQKEKTQSHKEILILKSEILRLKANISLEKDLQNQNISQQLNEMRHKYYSIQQKERQNHLHLKSQQQAMDRLNNSKNWSENHLKNQISKLKDEQSDQIRVYEHQIIELENINQELTIKNDNNKKKIDFLGQSHRQEIERLMKKCQIAQEQRNKATNSLNDTLSEFQNSQRHKQIEDQQKFKEHLHQISNYSKKIEELSRTILELKDQNLNLRVEFDQNQLKQKYITQQKIILDYELENARMKISSHQKDIEKLDNLLKDRDIQMRQFQKLKDCNNQKQMQLKVITQKLSTYHQSNLQKQSQFELSMKKKIEQYSVLLSKNKELSEQLELSQNNVLELQNVLQQSKVNYEKTIKSLSQKVKNLQEGRQQRERQCQYIIQKAQRQNYELQREKSAIFTDNQYTKNKYQKLQNQFQILKNQIQSQKEEKNQLNNYKLEDLNRKILLQKKQLQKLLYELKSNNQQCNIQIYNLKQKLSGQSSKLSQVYQSLSYSQKSNYTLKMELRECLSALESQKKNYNQRKSLNMQGILTEIDQRTQNYLLSSKQFST